MSAKETTHSKDLPAIGYILCKNSGKKTQTAK